MPAAYPARRFAVSVGVLQAGDSRMLHSTSTCNGMGVKGGIAHTTKYEDGNKPQGAQPANSGRQGRTP